MRFSACVLLGLSAACGGSENNGRLADAPFTTDAAPSVDAADPVDAAVAVDAAAPDAPPDAPTAGIVHVTVLDAGGVGAPAVGARVVFINPDGTVVKEATTDGNGKADATVMIGASVTSVQVKADTVAMQTTLGLVPGDDLVLGDKLDDRSAPTPVTVTWTPYTGTVNGYQIAGPCGAVSAPATAATATIQVYPYCKHATNEIVVAAMGAAGQVAASARVTGATLAAPVTIPDQWNPARTFTAAYTGINTTAVTSLLLSRVVPDGFGITTLASVARPDTTASLTTSGATGTTAVIRTTATNNGNAAMQLVLQPVAGSAATYNLDVGATLLPWLLPPTFDGMHTLHVTTDATGTSTARPDVVRVASSYRHTSATGVTTSITWKLYGPATGDLVLPPLPADVAGFLPVAGDALHLQSTALEAEAAGGYDAVRRDAAGAFRTYLSGSYTGGRVRQVTSKPPNT